MSDLGSRMKGYESVAQADLMRRTPVIVRCDGRSFSTWTRGAEKPFAWPIIRAMWSATKATMDEMQGCKAAYVQSDEASFVLTDTDTLATQPWFGGNLQKIVSIAASTFTANFNQAWRTEIFEGGGHTERLATFDARAFNLPPAEVSNYFLWRVRDCRRNSILGLAAAHFSPRQMHGKKTDELCCMLAEKGVVWEELAGELRFGKMFLLDGEAVPVAADYAAVHLLYGELP